MGQVVQAGAKMNPARQAAVKGGYPSDRPGHDGQPGVRVGRAGNRERPRKKSCWVSR